MLSSRLKPGFRDTALLRPRHVVLIAEPDRADGKVLARNLAAGGFKGRLFAIGVAPQGFEPVKHVAALPDPPDLAVLALPPERLESAMRALAARGCHAAIIPGACPDLAALSDRTGVRALGQGSFGIAVPAIGLNATLSHIAPRPGRLALVTQSSALARAVLDWAAAEALGFSHVVGIGGNQGIGFALVLDWLARDAATGAVLLDLRHIKNRRAFISALRAVARTRPVVALRAGGWLADAGGIADAVMGAALRRAGALRVAGLEELFAAAETLARMRLALRGGTDMRGDRVAIVANGTGLGALAADALLAGGGRLATVSGAARDAFATLLPAIAGEGAALRNPLSLGPLGGVRLGEVAAMLAALPEVDTVVALHAPVPDEDQAVSRLALAAAARATRAAPILVGWAGAATAEAGRRQLGEAGLAAFATPEAAVRGALILARDRQTRAAAAELPPRDVLDLAPNCAVVRRIFDRARAEGRDALMPDESLALLGAYGLPTDGAVADTALALRLRLGEDAMFGPWIGFGRGAQPAEPDPDEAFDLPPLNLSLAAALIARTRVARLLAAPVATGNVADALVRLSQIAVDFPEIATLDIDPLWADGERVRAGAATLRLRPPGAVSLLAIPPYPAELSHPWQARDGRALLVRPIRPEDAAAHAEAFQRLSAEDIRFRFFSVLRDLTPERIARLTQIDYEREMAFVAVQAVPGGPDRTMGVARLVREPGGDAAEFAIIVAPEWKGQGLARHLMERLFAWARSVGITVIEGQILAENTAMLGFAHALGFVLHPAPDDEAVIEARLEL